MKRMIAAAALALLAAGCGSNTYKAYPIDRPQEPAEPGPEEPAECVQVEHKYNPGSIYTYTEAWGIYCRKDEQ